MSPSTDQRENREFAAELKFVVPPAIGAQVREWARACLRPDPNAGSAQSDVYHITSLYFDTALFDVFRRKGSFGRSKYRIRRYGHSDTVFLERKLKTRGLVSKRRSVVPIDEIPRLNAVEPTRGWPGFWYHQRLQARRLRPVCQIAYDRTARVEMTANGPVRLTIDQDIRAVPLHSLGFVGTPEDVSLLENEIIELKFRSEMPALFRQLVHQFSLIPQSTSKYRLAVSRLALAPESVLNEAEPARAKAAVA